MALSTISGLLLATPFAATLLPLTVELIPLICALGKLIVVYRTGPITPTTTHQYECDLQSLLRDIGRVIFQWSVNHVELEDVNRAPPFAFFDNDLYKRRNYSPRRGGIATLFGTIFLCRIRYEPCDAGMGLTCIFPLEMRLGIVAGKATPGLASRLSEDVSSCVLADTKCYEPQPADSCRPRALGFAPWPIFALGQGEHGRWPPSSHRRKS